LPSSPHSAPFEEGEFRWSMGLEALDLHDWIEVDDRSDAELGEKERLLDAQHGAVFDSLPESQEGSEEVLELLVEHLPARFPDLYRRDGDEIVHLQGSRRWALTEGALHPLDLAGRMVQEDLCLMREDAESGLYRLVAASLCFPTAWTLADKIGRSLGTIHAPIPNYESQLSSTMDRYFARIRVDHPVSRLNWGLMGSPELFQPKGRIKSDLREGITADNAGDRLWVRVERQTLRRLPRSRDILFTIRIYVRPLRDLSQRAEETARMAAAVRSAPSEVAGYKGFTHVQDALLGWLDRVDPPSTAR
jgi:hypothetical protein